MLREMFIAIRTCLKKQEKNQINNLTLQLKQLGKEEMKNPRVSRRKERIKIRVEINEKRNKETLAKKNKIKIISTIFSDHNTVRLDVNYRGKKNY